MMSSAANEVDSVFVLFTAHSKNNVVLVLLHKAQQQLDMGGKEGNDFTVYLPSCHENKHVKDNQCSGIFGSLNSLSSPPVMRNVTCRRVQNIFLPHAH